MNFVPSRASIEIHVPSSGLEQKDNRPSMLYNVLPAVMQSRLPALPSLRRSISDFRGRAIHNKNASITTITSETTALETPPPTYSSRRSSDEHSRTSIGLADIEEMDFRDDVSERPASSISTPPPFAVSETVTGINWKFANQGISLLTQAYQESITLSSDADKVSANLTRQLYLHGMTYLLRGLPSHLTQEETLSLCSAIPDEIVNILNNPSTHTLIPRSRPREIIRRGPSQPPSILHRITATIVFQVFLLFQFLLPYIKLFIGQAYRFERDHKVTQRIMSKSILTVDELGRRGLQLSQTICQMNDGKVGQAIHDTTIWWVQGLTGGIQQGISDGVFMIGSERPASLGRKNPDKSI